MRFKIQSKFEKSFGASLNYLEEVELYNELHLLIKEGEYHRVIQQGQELLDRWLKRGYQFPDVYRLYNNMGLCCMQLGKQIEAYKLFNIIFDALDIKPEELGLNWPT